MSPGIESAARKQDVIVMAGAGVSAGNPSALPGWNALNARIAEVLADRLESAIERPGWVARFLPSVTTMQEAQRFPPDYQAQIIEEMCGDHYFRALQSLDVDAINSCHSGIAALAAAGALRAVVTTNFDRLIEQALDHEGIEHVVARTDSEYVDMLPRLVPGERDPLPVIKIHGCVSDHRSMIDTLKQRKRGRSRCIQDCLHALQTGHWLYLGFSAADLETDRDYLGLLEGASNSQGATYLAYPPHPALRKGAAMLMGSYGGRGEVVVSHVGPYLADLCEALGARAPRSIPEDSAAGSIEVDRSLQAWARDLPAFAAGLCLSAILEAVGQAEVAVRILDRLVRNELYDQRETVDFRLVQLHYGRLGAAWGRFFAVADLSGSASNASVETSQSLLRLRSTELEFAATTWLACLELWLNDGRQAMGVARELLGPLVIPDWDGARPRSDEESVDAWLSAALVTVLSSDEDFLKALVASAKSAFECATRCGDVVRAARVVSLQGLALAAATGEDVPSLLTRYEGVFEDAERVSDGVALGMRALALGRWYSGIGGLALARESDSETVAEQALTFLSESIHYFDDQGMDPWVVYALIQETKAYADLQLFDDAQASVDAASGRLARFPIMASHLLEAVGQVRATQGDENARESFEAAVLAAEESGLSGRVRLLERYLSQ